MRMISSVGSSIGQDHGSPVSTRYEGSFPFQGELHEIDIQLGGREEAAGPSPSRNGTPMITVTLLGTGSPMPSPDRAGPATLITAGDGEAGSAEHYLVDAGAVS